MVGNMSHEILARNIDTYYVVKRKDTGEYFEDVWEEHHDDINYSFTSDISKAFVFYPYMIKNDDYAPKYLWDDVHDVTIQSVTHMCRYFNAEVVQVMKETQWSEI